MNTPHTMNGVAAGTLVGHNVRLKRLLGRGGMGSVWVAEHEALQSEVAVKFISPEIAARPEAVARFKREATAAAQLRSPHVVQIFDHGVTPEGLPFIVMELLEGEDLATRIGRLGRLPVAEVVTVVGQACKALGRAHARGIVHRDIKPDNIYLVDSDGESFVKLLDFGIAKRSEDAALNMTTTGTMVGTPYFMSPEQVMSAKDADFRSDLWSLAVVAYNALSGRVPFFAETLGALCVAIHAGNFMPVTSGQPELPAALDGWFQRALARDPAARFGSAKELAEAFARAAGSSSFEPARVSQSSLSVVSGPPQAPESSTLLGATVTHPGAPKHRKRTTLVAVAGTLGALVVAGGLLAQFAHRVDDGVTDASAPALTPSAVPSAPRAESARPPMRAQPLPASPASAAPVPSASAAAVSKPLRQAPRSRNTASSASSAHRAKGASPTTPPRKDKDYGF